MRRFSSALLVLSLTASLASPATAASAEAPDYERTGAPRLGPPVDCREPELCSVQNYVDFAPGVEALDHTCGPLTYNGHKGVDIRLRSIADMERGVAVLAAASGRVIARRNDVPDRLLNEIEARKALAGPVKPSNSVSLYHGNGWTTHYGHLRKGSVTVQTGQTVKQGQPLGLVGASGSTNFPHLHFTLMLRDQAIDPYSGRKPHSGCGAGIYHSFWNKKASALLAYRTSGVLNAGFAEAPPAIGSLSRHAPSNTPLPATAEQLVFWTRIWGLRRNDRIRMRLYAANGALLAEITQRANDNNAISVQSLAMPRRTNAWPKGTYRGEYLLERQNGSGDGKFSEVLNLVRKVEIR